MEWSKVLGGRTLPNAHHLVSSRTLAHECLKKKKKSDF